MTAAGACAAAPFQNGSFENGISSVGGFTQIPGGDSTSITGWTTTLGGVDLIGSWWQAADGSRSLDLNRIEVGGIEQEFDTLVGQRYRATFALARNPDGGPMPKLLDMLIEGAWVGTAGYLIDTTTRADMQWRDVSFEFVATQALTTLSFVSATTADSGNTSVPHAFGPALDNVRVTAVPEPSLLALLGVGLAALGARRRLRKS